MSLRETQSTEVCYIIQNRARVGMAIGYRVLCRHALVCPRGFALMQHRIRSIH